MSTVTVSNPIEAWVDGRLVRMWTVTEDSVASGDAWALSGLPQFFTITLFEAQLVTAGSATSIDPELGISAGWQLDTLNHIAENDKPATWIRTSCTLKVSSPAGELHGRSKPTLLGGGTAGQILTRITIVEGH